MRVFVSVALALLACGCGGGTDGKPVPPPTSPAPEPSAPPTYPRATSDQPDDLTGPQIHLVYAIASDGEDRELDTDGTIRDMLANMQEFLAERIGQQFRIDTHAGEPDITFVRLDATEEELLLFGVLQDPVVSVLVLSPLLADSIERDPEKLYAVFYTFDWEENYVTGQAAEGVAGTYISHRSLGRFGDPNRQRIFETTMIHELFHLLGAVPNCAPNQGRGNHAIDHELDVMTSGSPRPQWEWTHIDWGNDDYYGHGREDCVDIALSPYFEPVRILLPRVADAPPRSRP